MLCPYITQAESFWMKLDGQKDDVQAAFMRYLWRNIDRVVGARTNAERLADELWEDFGNEVSFKCVQGNLVLVLCLPKQSLQPAAGCLVAWLVILAQPAAQAKAQDSEVLLVQAQPLSQHLAGCLDFACRPRWTHLQDRHHR
jgi:hypothetical protein